MIRMFPGNAGEGLVDPSHILVWATRVDELGDEWIGDVDEKRGNNYLYAIGEPSNADGRGVQVMGSGAVGNIEAQTAGAMKLLQSIVVYQERFVGDNIVRLRLHNVTKATTIYTHFIDCAGSGAAWARDIVTGTLESPLGTHNFEIGDKIALQAWATGPAYWCPTAIMIAVY